MNQDRIDEIKNNILKELERNKKEKEDAKLLKKEKPDKKDRNLEQAKQWQQKYIKEKQDNGEKQVASFIKYNNLVNIDKYIVEKTKTLEKLSRSDVINLALDKFFK